MDALSSAAGAVADFLKPGKAKLVQHDPKGGAGGGGGGGFGALAAALPIPGLGPEDKDTEISFMFNPTEYRISRSVEVTPHRQTFKSRGSLEYLGTGLMTLTMQLFFDDFASAKGDVTPKIKKLFEWQLPNKDEQKPPPLVKFEWGNKQLDTFTGVITQINCTYTVFRRDGTPVQAKVDLTIQGGDEVEFGTNPTSHAVDMRRVHVVVEGETLASVAYAELGRPGYWRAIAAFNDIDDPLRVAPGLALLIPSAADAARNG